LLLMELNRSGGDCEIVFVVTPDNLVSAGTINRRLYTPRTALLCAQLWFVARCVYWIPCALVLLQYGEMVGEHEGENQRV
jgi:hypothetical protein